HNAPDPAQVDIHRTDRPATHYDACRRPVVRDCIDDLALVLNTRVDNLDCRNHVFRCTQYVGQTNARAHQPLAHDESELDFNPRLTVISVLHFGTVSNQLIVENVAIVGLIDHR